MGFIRERKLKNGTVRYQAEIRLKGHRTLTAGFDRKTDARTWIQKTEADIRCGRHQLYSEGKRHIFSDAVERYFKEHSISVVKRGHLLWWKSQLGSLYLHDIRPAILTEKKQKLLSEPNQKGVIRGKSTCNRFLASLSHLLNICVKEWEWINENPVRKISREKEPRERTRFLSAEERVRFLEACRNSSNPNLFSFVVFLLSTGCRYNEIRDFRRELEGYKFTAALNLPIQGAAAEITLRAMIRFTPFLSEECHLVNVIHDELLLEVIESKTSIYASLAQEAMEKAFLDIFPNSKPYLQGLVESTIGQNWGELK